MSIQKIVTALLLLVFTVSACAPAAGTEQPTPTGDAQAGLLDQEWVLQSMGAAGSQTAVIEGSTVTLTLGSDGSASGTAGCNSFGSSYSIKGDQISFSDIVSTLMACADDAVTEQERLYLEALQSTGKFTVTQDTLTIEYDGGASVLSFARADNLPTPTAAPMSMTDDSTVFSSAYAGLGAFLLLSDNVSTAVPTTVPPGQTPVSTAEPPQGAVPTPTPAPVVPPVWYSDTTYQDDRSTATGLIESYFNAINRKEYLRAYSYWRTPEASLGKYENFAAGFRQTARVKVRLGEIGEGIAAGQVYYSVPILIKALTTTGEHQRFIACYVLQLSQPASQGLPPFMPLGIARGKARVVETPGHARELLASACGGSDRIGVPMKPAPVTDPDDVRARNYLDDRSDPTQLMRSLVNAINRKEYVRAYSYWEHTPGSANVPPYEQFARGYADTAKVELMVGIVQGDAGAGQFYYSIPVVMIAQTARGVTQTFAGCYHLHLSNPALQSRPPFQPLAIQSAEVRQVDNLADPVRLLARACTP